MAHSQTQRIFIPFIRMKIKCFIILRLEMFISCMVYNVAQICFLCQEKLYYV